MNSRQKRALAKTGATRGAMTMLVGALIVILLVSSIGPTIFENLGNFTAGPAWLGTTLTVVAAAGVLLMVWRSIGGPR